MAVESAVTLETLNASLPLPSDSRRQGDDHIRLLKAVLKAQFPGASGNGFSIPIAAVEQEINRLSGLTVNIQLKFNSIDSLIAALTPLPVAAPPTANLIFRSGTWAEDGYKIGETSSNSFTTDSYRSGDYILLTSPTSVNILADAVSTPGKVLTFEKSNGVVPVNVIDGTGVVYGPNLDPIEEDGKVFSLICTDINQWRLIR